MPLGDLIDLLCVENRTKEISQVSDQIERGKNHCMMATSLVY
jgi:hypothetical protein